MDITPTTPTRLGYARVSTAEQTLDSQTDALTAAGCARVWSEHASGADRTRGQLAAVLDHLRPGDVLVITKLDRLARSTAHLIELAAHLAAAGVDLVVLDQAIDTTTPAGKLMFTLLGAVGEFERDLIRSRTMDGLAAARARGRVGGRPVACTPETVEAARALLAGGMSKAAVARQLKIERTTLWRHLSADIA
jgi:DNA invertase Pin-like site-specific DNA recombinase